MCSGEATIDELQPLCSQFYTPLREYLCHVRNNPVVPALVVKSVTEMGYVEKLFAEVEKLCDEAERENTPEATDEEKRAKTIKAMSHLLHTIMLAEIEPTFHKINVHAAMTPSEVKILLEPIICRANFLLETYQQREQRMQAKESIPTSPSSVDLEGTPLVTVRK